jgi:hypothetical protein
MALFTQTQLRSRSAARLITESLLGASRTATTKLENASTEFTSQKTYDIFLSHSALDADVIFGLKLQLEASGYTAYVYWIEDPQSRNTVDATTAAKLKVRMANCKGLLYAASQHSSASRWMPWELGYFDGIKRRVAIAPIETSDTKYYFEGFKGQEYLDLYPYVALSDAYKDQLYVWRQDRQMVGSLRHWLDEEP